MVYAMGVSALGGTVGIIGSARMGSGRLSSSSGGGSGKQLGTSTWSARGRAAPAAVGGSLRGAGAAGRDRWVLSAPRATEDGFPETAADGVLREGAGAPGAEQVAGDGDAATKPAPKPVCFEADGVTACTTCGGSGRQMWQLSKLIPFARSFRPCPNYRGAYRAAGQGVDEIFFGADTDRSKPRK